MSKQASIPQVSTYRWIIGGLCFLLLVLIAAVIHTGVMNKKLLTLATIREEHPFIDPAQSLYDKDGLIINVTPLRTELEKLGAHDPDLTIYFEVFGTGANISINNTTAIWPASLMKIPVAMAVMKRVEEGEWRLDDQLLLLEQDKDAQYGDLYLQPSGSAHTIRSLLEEVLIESDNTARTIFMRNLDFDEIQGVLDHLGLEDIFGTDQAVRAKKYSIFWRSLYTASFLNAENSEFLIEIMSRSIAREYLRQGLPDNVLFSHKIGWADDVHSDSGIVYVLDRPYILTVMTRNKTEEEARQLMAQISKLAYDHVANY